MKRTNEMRRTGVASRRFPERRERYPEFTGFRAHPVTRPHPDSLTITSVLKFALVLGISAALIGALIGYLVGSS
jgi:hypothetical protein